MAKLELPSDKEIASQLIQSEHQGRLLEIGWIGRIIGTKEQAPFNIAGAKGLIALVAFVWLLVFPSPTSSSDIASRTLPPIVLAVLGYIFGKGGR